MAFRPAGAWSGSRSYEASGMSALHDRVRTHTRPEINARLDDRMRDRLLNYATASDGDIAKRIEALDAEWDIERYVEVLGPGIALAGLLLGVLGKRRWLLLPVAVLGLLAQHAVQGHCAPVALLRSLGVRTRREIDEERFALKALRGDFGGLPPDAPRNRVSRVDAVLDAVRM